MGDIHRMAVQGYQTAASTYRAGRPDYPKELIAILHGDLSIGHGKAVLDLGAGTGKFTTLLASTGADVIAVEPVEAMRRELAAALPAVDLRDGTAAHIPMPDAAVDAVFCAQSFHWFATRATLDEIHRVLKPGGLLGLVWNVRDESVGWVAALTDLIAPYQDDTPRYRDMVWRALFPTPGFTDLNETSIPYAHEGRVEQIVLDRFMSISFVAAQTPEIQRSIEAGIHDLITRTAALSGPGPASFPYNTCLYTCRKAD